MTPQTDSPSNTVDFWFDPTCPWAWMTSRWVDEVSELRNLDVSWHIMSLAVLNEDREVDEAHRASHQRGLRYGRLIAAASHRHGPSSVKPLYDALGTRIHLQGRQDADAIIAEALTETGLPQELQAFAAQKLARFKVPAYVFFRDEPLPRTATGKVLKRDLREQVTANAAGTS